MITRRKFLKAAGLASAGLTLGSISPLTASTAAGMQRTKEQTNVLTSPV